MNFRFVLPALLAGLGSTLTTSAQTFTNLYTFSATWGNSAGQQTNSDGALPGIGLVLSNNVLYGTAQQGGTHAAGTLFRVNIDGAGFTNLHNFNSTDGNQPVGAMILLSNTLYGTTWAGGSSGNGTVFAVHTDGSGFTNLHNFDGSAQGANPSAGLLLSGNSLYGVARLGGSSPSSPTQFGGNGTVFKVNLDGTGFTVLHTFVASATNSLGTYTNSEGANPVFELVLSGDRLYGSTFNGGTSGYGTIFAINTNGTGFTNLHNFIGSDGVWPQGALAMSNNVLYGATMKGGSADTGTIFKLNADGTGFSTLYEFTALPNTDGAAPRNGLSLSGTTLYGTAANGGGNSAMGNGTVFRLNTDGTGFTTLYNFPDETGGESPVSRLTVSGRTLYGTAAFLYGAGPVSYGAVFSLFVPPQLTISSSGSNVLLTWPTDAIGFVLQSTTNLGSSPIWTTNLPSPVVVNGQNTVTNPISGTQQFYRLAK